MMKTRIWGYLKMTLMSLAAVLTLTMCGDDGPDVDKPDATHRKSMTLLIYAVASNNLYSNLISDKQEMLKAAPQIDLEQCSLLIYEVTDQEGARLLELDKKGTAYGFTTLRTYSRNKFSTDPERMSEVLADSRRLRPADRSGLIFWSHGSGWMPGGSNHNVPKTMKTKQMEHGNITPLPDGWFGWDTYEGVTDHIDIIELQEALGESRYDFIWFDCCYMASIEVIYQLRGNCDYFVGYPMEIAADGMPYDLTLPLLLKPKPNLVAAADVLCEHYISQNIPVAAMVGDMSKIEPLAEAVRKYYLARQDVSTFRLFTYSRGSYGPYYDLQQYWNNALADMEGAKTDIKDAIGGFVVYRRASERGFNNRVFPKDGYCCISTVMEGDRNVDDAFYFATAWGGFITGNKENNITANTRKNKYYVSDRRTTYSESTGCGARRQESHERAGGTVV